LIGSESHAGKLSIDVLARGGHFNRNSNCNRDRAIERASIVSADGDKLHP